jgi:hypothetical protein
MNGTRLQKIIYQKGYGKVAEKVGLLYSAYRPTAAINPSPISNATLLGTLDAQFYVDDKLLKPEEYGKVTWKGWFDASDSQQGDYLIGPQGTFYIVSLQALIPPLMVWCTQVVNFYRPPPQSNLGSNTYGGTTLANQVEYMAGWPAAIVETNRRREGDISLPGDMLHPWWHVYLPASINTVQIESADIMTDNLGRRFIVSSAEKTPLGWRLLAQQALT